MQSALAGSSGRLCRSVWQQAQQAASQTRPRARNIASTCKRAAPTSLAKGRPLPDDLSAWNDLLDIHPAKRIDGPSPSPSQPPSYQIYHINEPPLFGSALPPTPSQMAEVNTTEDVIGMLAKTTAFSQKEIKNFHRYALVIHRVSVQTSKGKIASMYAMVVAGNGDGLVGVGQGKHTLTVRAIDKAFVAAVKNMQPVDRNEKRTVWGEQRGSWCATDIVMWPRPPGFGLRTSPLIHQIAKAAGITDLSAKVRGSRNAMNTVKCAVKMLQKRSYPEGLGDGFGGTVGRKNKGRGMLNAPEIAATRGRRAVPI